MKYLDFVKRVSEELNIPEEVVKEAYKSYWVFIKKTIKELPLKSITNEGDFNKLKTNFNIPSLGKFCCTYEKVLNNKKRFDYTQNLKENVKN